MVARVVAPLQRNGGWKGEKPCCFAFVGSSPVERDAPPPLKGKSSPVDIESGDSVIATRTRGAMNIFLPWHRTLRGLQALLVTISALHLVAISTPASAQAFPTQRPGTTGVGNMRLRVFAVYNSQFTGNTAGATRPRSPFGRGFTPIGGYIYQRGPTVVYVDDTGFETLFNKVGATFVSEHRVRGDLTEIVPLPAGYRVVDEDDNSQTYDHIFGGRAYLTSVRDAEQRVLTQLTWRNGIPIRVGGSKGGETSFTSDSRGLITAIRTSEGLAYQLSYSANEELLEVKAGNTTFLTLEYDGQGNVTQVKDVQGNSTLYEYEVGGRLKAARDESSYTKLTYTNNSVTTETHDPNGVFFSKTSFQPLGALLLPTREEQGFNEAARGGITTLSTQRDPSGNISSVSSAMGQVTSFVRDRNGLPLKVTFPDKSSVKVVRDGNNKSRITRVIRKSPSGELISTTETLWDKHKVLSSRTVDSKNRTLGTSTISRNGRERVQKTTEATFYTYSPRGPKGIVTGQVSSGGEHSITFDSYGLPTSFKSDGVAVSIAARLNTDGSSSTILSSSVFGETREQNFFGTAAQQVIGNPSGTFIARSSSEVTARALSGSSSFASEAISGDARAGVSVSEAYEVLPNGGVQRQRRVTFSGN